MSDTANLLSRKEFLNKTVNAAAGFAAVPFLANASFAKNPAVSKKKIAIVGTGVRGVGMWGSGLLKTHSDYVELVGLCDINKLRLKVAQKMIGTNAPLFTDFDEMIKKTKPDLIIVTTMDSTHAHYIIRGMELGCDVLAEKPMATDEKQAQAILDAERKTGKNLIVTFNYRFADHIQKIKELLLQGDIGRVVSVDFDWYLDIYHGASYFRRWHALRKYSGSLLVHKSTHHFDIMNWFLDAEPAEVFAFGELKKYGRNGSFRGKSCRTCQHKDKCEFYWDITKDKRLMELYVSAEEEDGYIRDGCVFRNEIDICDTRSVNVKYNSDVHMSYSLNNFLPYEGFHLGFNGLNGRLECREFARQPWEENNMAKIRLTKNFGKTYTFDIPRAGGHGGGDIKLKDMVFKKDVPDPLNQRAGSRAGAMSILTGIAARHSIDEKRPVKIDELIKLY
ncbi:Gfo/Idh/MocA family oxidoreductase [bacterium]|nr:Gfo/Idh/MocA family oxidoreductase [bacterium]